MGCFTALKGKKKFEQTSCVRSTNARKHLLTVLPEPQTGTPTLHSAPPSFRARVKPLQSSQGVCRSRIRTLSSPSGMDAAEQFSSVYPQSEELEEQRIRIVSGKEHNSLRPQPLPLPSSFGANALKPTPNFRIVSNSEPLDMSGPLPLPPCPIPTSLGAIVDFPYEEIASACDNFSPERCVSEGLYSTVYRATFSENVSGWKKFEAMVIRLHSSNQGLREFVNDVNMLASLQHQFLCKLIGFHARENSDFRMLVYERLFHGSLDKILYGRSNGPPIDWNSRMRVALSAAQGLTFLHEEGPFQAMFYDFTTVNIQIDKDFSAKLSGYGCVGHIPEVDSSECSALGNLSVETLERGLLTPKSNVWSFGVVLLELLTGRKNLDIRQLKEERNLVRWSRPFLADDCRLSLIMDPQLKGHFPVKAARKVADIAQQCLNVDPSERPTMRTVVDHLKSIQDMKYTSRFPLQVPREVHGKYMSRSPSLNMIITPAPKSLVSPSPPAARQTLLLPTLSLPPRRCSSTLLWEESDRQGRQESRKSSSSVSYGYM